MKRGSILGFTVLFGLCLVGLMLFEVNRTSAAMLKPAMLGVDTSVSGWTMTPQAWETDWVEQGEYYDGTERVALAIDADGDPHFAVGFDYLYYTWRDGGIWYTKRFDNEIQISYPSIELDGDGNPHISFYNGMTDDLKYTTFDGADWQTSAVDTAGNVGRFSDLVLDPTSPYTPQLSYYDDSLACLKYAQLSEAGWLVTVVDDSTDYVGQYTGIALDAAGNPSISYYAGTLYSGFLKYAWFDGSAWYSQTVDNSSPAAGKYTSLVINGANVPLISYSTGTSNSDDLKYAWFDGTWYSHTVDIGGGAYTSIGFEPTAPYTTHISYYDGYHRLKHAKGTGTTWQNEIVDGPDPWVGEFTDLAITTAGGPRIAYFDRSNQSIKYARIFQGDWISETVAYGSENGRYSSIAVDDLGIPHVSYLGELRGLKYAVLSGTAWITTVVDAGRDIGKDTSIDINSVGEPSISYYAGHPFNDLRYAWQDSSGWYTITVDSAGTTGQFSSLAVDSLDIPHIGFRSGKGGVYHAWMEGSAWLTETVDATKAAGQNLAITVDQFGVPYIAYNAGYDIGLNMAKLVDSTWITETVDDTERVGNHVSIAVDAWGRPHISYQDYRSPYNLRYAVKEGSSWNIEVADSDNGAGYYTSIGVDHTGTPQISYYKTSDSSLNYAWKSAGEWHTQIADNEGQVGHYSSLALDPDGNLHISYASSYPSTDLKYAITSLARSYAIYLPVVTRD